MLWAEPYKRQLKGKSRRSVPALHTSKPRKPGRFAYVAATFVTAKNCLV
jgi:hypothetical protein